MKPEFGVTQKKIGRTNLFELELERPPTVDTKEVAHAIAGGRTGTAVVSLVGVQPGAPARRVRRERRGPDYHRSQLKRDKSPNRTFDTKEAAHAIAGGRTGTAVVPLVCVQPGAPARRVRREHREPTQPRVSPFSS